MAFADLVQDLMGVYKADHTEPINHNGTQEDTDLGDITENCSTHLKYGEALENIKSAAKVRTSGESKTLSLKKNVQFFHPTPGPILYWDNLEIYFSSI